MSNKLNIFKGNFQKARESIRYTNNIAQTDFKDKFVEFENKGQRIPFKHNWAMLSHMHDLRLWTIAYAPSKTNNLQRLQELHRINNEALYMLSSALWKRVMLGFVLFMFINKFAKHKYLNNGAKDSHEVSFRDNTAHL